ncbi:helix-turn-helix domain-containing protein [Carboxydochorda subterranea]|uniref:Helix-turn-helix domain-containing protein n=1 Tax=Carboxydichorda subterranea TaxID=3109565 RepID=A0ABZ1BXN3_9FIRM|nr:helix-turn-helix domain-containing protein [Limnochorda sp. L945t]WRP16822.1 helix-turn-helix domain-containing protein [Limnochorda sp. L945t]
MTRLAVDWVSVKEACQILGVHETTLRRWTDEGRISAFRTPGGHRRYRRADLLAFLARGQNVPAEGGVDHLARLALSATRQELGRRLPGEPWRARYRTREEALRASGRQLLGLLVHFAARPGDGESYLHSARQIMRRYGEEAVQMGLSAAETARAFLVFRQSIMQALAQSLDRPPAGDPEGWQILQRAGRFFDELLVATLERYGPGGHAPALPDKEATG